MLRHTTAYPVLQSQRVIRCSFCPYDTEDPEQLRQHLDSHDNIDKATSLNGKVIYTRVDITNLACHACGDKFETLEAAASHLHNKHNMSLDLDASLGLVPLRLERNKFECIVCQRKYTGFKALYRHAGEHYTTRVCDMCGRKFETKPALENHIARNHLAILCKMCKMSFESVEARRQHVRESEKCRPFACTMCPVRFLSWDHRQNHLESVHKRPKMVFPCKECSEIFSNRQMLYFHFKKKHTDDCVCSFCGKHFKARRELSQHLAMHTGIRPWKCEVCDKAFGGPKSLGNHMRIHDDSKKSKCTLCGRLFVGASKLKGHFQKRHPDAYSEHYS